MGSCYQSMRMSESIKNEKKLYKVWKGIIEDLLYYHGHDSYNGTFSTCRGLSLVNKTFLTESQADDWIMENAQKWGEALCVRVLSVKPFKDTARGKKLQADLTALRATNPRDEAIEKFHVKYKKAELKYRERKANGKFPKYSYYVGAWCAE